MLRLGAKTELLIRKREPLISLNLLRGIALAFALHLLLLLGLRIASPPNADLFLPLTPVAVEVDLGLPQLHSPIATQVILSPIELVELPQYFEMPQPQLVSQLDCYPRVGEPDFSEIEKIEYVFVEDLEEHD